MGSEPSERDSQEDEADEPEEPDGSSDELDPEIPMAVPIPSGSAQPPEPTPRPPAGSLREVATLFVGITIATAIVTHLPSVLPGIDGYVHLLVGAIFLVVAVRVAQREPSGMRRHGIDLAGLLTPPSADDERPAGPLGLFDLGRAIRGALPAGLRETGVALGLAALIFPPFVVGFYFWHGPGHAFRFALPDDILSFALTQLLVVALPEEALFRGTIQTRLHDAWPPRRSILGARLDVRAWLLQAALFAAVHFASIPHPARLAVFFPALLFGWMRAWRGGIGAAMLLHALSNVLAEILEKGWLR